MFSQRTGNHLVTKWSSPNLHLQLSSIWLTSVGRLRTYRASEKDLTGSPNGCYPYKQHFLDHLIFSCKEMAGLHIRASNELYLKVS